MILNEFFNLPQVFEKQTDEGIFGSRPSPVLPVVDKIAKVASGLTPRNVEVGKQIIQNKASEITRMLSPQTKPGVDVIEQGVAEGSENNNTTAQKIFFARSNKTPKGWSYDHVGFITQDGKQIQMSGHKGNDVYVTNDVTDDPEFPKQNIKIVSLSKPVSVPTTNSVGAENCGTFVANVLQANGIKGIDTQKIYSVFKKPQPQEQGVAEGVRTESAELAKQYGWAYNQGEYGASMTHPKHGRISLSSPVTSRSGDTAVEREWTHNNASGIGDRSLAQHLQSLKEQGMTEAKDDYVPPKEADYGPEYQAMVRRVGEKARAQEKAKQQPPKAPVRESRLALLKQIIQS